MHTWGEVTRIVLSGLQCHTFVLLQWAHQMSLDWTRPILEQSYIYRITLQHTAKWMCAVILLAKVTLKIISAMDDQGRPTPVYIEYYYLFLNLLNRELACNWIPLFYDPIFEVQVAQKLVGTHFSPMWWEALQVKSLA